MVSRRHVNATTTQQMRAFIQESQMPISRLAKVLNVSETTVRKWKLRKFVEDRSSMAKNLQTTMSPEEEWAAVHLRIHLLLSLDPLLSVVRTYINSNVSRSALDRCLRRHGVSRLSEVKAMLAKGENFFTSIHSPLNQMSDRFVNVMIYRIPEFDCAQDDILRRESESSMSETAIKSSQRVDVNSSQTGKEANRKDLYLFVAVEPKVVWGSDAWIYVDIFDDEVVDAAGRYIVHALETAPFRLRKTLVKNYREFSAKYSCISELTSNHQEIAV